MNEWFSVNGLSLNIDKTKIVKFSSNCLHNDQFEITYQNKAMEAATHIKFLGLALDMHMSWTTHIAKILPKMSRACYAVRIMYHFSSLTTLKTVYFACFHPIVECGIIFWGNSTESKRIFQLQKKIIRIMTGSRSATHCKPLFKSLEILTLPSEHILSSMKFLSYNLEFYTSNFSVHGTNTRSRLQLYKPITNLKLYQK
jgi:hypothetical protein